VYIIVYVVFFVLAIDFSLQKLVPASKGFRTFSVTPMVAGAADYMEDVCIGIMLHNYPRQLNVVGKISNYMTMTKLIFVSTSFAGLVLLGSLLILEHLL
jgi:hypothetical protein